MKGTIDKRAHICGYLQKDKATNQVRISKQAGADAVPIETEYVPVAWNQEITLLKVHLITGRTHQIRAHLAWQGHPLLGDPKYGDPKWNRKWNGRMKTAQTRQMLHAYELVMPEMNKTLKKLSGRTFTAPVPEDFYKIIKETWNSRGLRGSTLEDFVNRTNEYYMEKNLALIQKIPTPITPVRMDKEHRQITLAYFEQRSTVDYIGVVQGIPVCFDAKECVADTFPLQNIHEHQIEFMGRFEKQEGIAFFLLYYSAKNILYYMRYEEMMKFWNREKKGGRKSFRLEELDPEFFMELRRGSLVPYLDGINKDLDVREQKQK